jgi:hypothetical protein
MTIFNKRTQSEIFLALALVVGSLIGINLPETRPKNLEQVATSQSKSEIVRQLPEHDLYPGLVELMRTPRELTPDQIAGAMDLGNYYFILKNHKYDGWYRCPITNWDLLSMPWHHIPHVDPYGNPPDIPYYPRARGPRVRITNIRPIRDPGRLEIGHDRDAKPMPSNTENPGFRIRLPGYKTG